MTLKKHYDAKLVKSLNYVDLLCAIREQVLNTIIVSISTPDRAHANLIFEILNAKGKRLANIDLIKNKIFEELYEVSPADYAEETWKEIKEILYNDKAQIGFASFFRHYWVSKYQKVSDSKLYDSFNKTKILPRNHDSYTSFLEDLRKNAKWYVQIVNPERSYWDNKKQFYTAVQFLARLSNDFSIVQARIALLALFDVRERELISHTTFVNTISKLERFHYVYNSICSRRGSTIEKPYSDFAIGIRKCNDKSEAQEWIKMLFQQLDKLYPEYDEFVSRFVKLRFSAKKDHPDNLKSKYAVYMLYGYEEGDYLNPERGSIEHILPESSGEEAYNIGNLIALETDINQDCAAKSYSEKLEDYRRSKYTCVANFIAKHNVWEASDIENRAREMADTLYHEILIK